VKTFLAKLGPGLVTGAADDDPSGIGTYSIAGARFGYAPLWIAWFTFPLMSATQLMCARLGMVSGRGLGALLRLHYGNWVLWPACFLLAVANVVNIAADLGAMAASTEMLTAIPHSILVIAYTLLLAAALIWSSYRRIAATLKYMTLVLFAYVAAAWLAHPNWDQVLRATILPQIQWSRSYLSVFVAILGTTISPYLFFWQATQEVEEDRERGRVTLAQRQGATEREKADSRVDVMTGMLLSNVIMYFIVLTAAATLHSYGHTQIETTQQAAEALRPLAGRATYLLFTLGIVGTGMLSVPVLAGSTAYAISEGAKWRNSLKYSLRSAPRFYGVLAIVLLLGMALNYIGFGVVSMLFWSAVINGVLAPPLVVLVVLLSSRRDVMGRHICSPPVRALGWLTAIVMTFAAVAMFVT
jgi:NRAMP (natural resistance-associated macrophage protein)-like metal ion transporter